MLYLEGHRIGVRRGDEMPSPRVSFYYDPDVGNFNYGTGHPMKPHRIRMAQSLIVNYGLFNEMQIIRPPRASFEDITRFHTDEYISFLKSVSPQTMGEYGNRLHKFNVGDDCPVFDGLYEYCQISAGGSIASATRVNHGDCDFAINWAGGLHHAKRVEASGFCYVNDIVLACLELLKYHARVLYIDIDVHHGDGVEEAFYTTDRVMTVSFHKFGEFFPGTGDIRDIGKGRGKNYSVNVPLRDGIDDESYASLFKPIIEHVVKWYRPGAIVLQCGSDSLAGDRLGCFNLSSRGHAQCVDFVKSFGLPVIFLGGGGYTIRNVARCWALETAVIVGREIPEEIPFNEYFDYYGPDYSLTVPASNMANLNTPQYLEKVRERIFEQLRRLPHAPGVSIVPRPDDFPWSQSDQEDSDDGQEGNAASDDGDFYFAPIKRVPSPERPQGSAVVSTTFQRSTVPSITLPSDLAELKITEASEKDSLEAPTESLADL